MSENEHVPSDALVNTMPLSIPSFHWLPVMRYILTSGEYENMFTSLKAESFTPTQTDNLAFTTPDCCKTIATRSAH